MFLACALSLVMTASQPSAIGVNMTGVTWHTSYEKATDLAIQEKKDLVIYFQSQGELDAALANTDVAKKLESFICLKIPTTYQVGDKRLLDYPVLSDMMGKPGLALVSCHDKKLPTYLTVVSAHPVVGSRYRWVPA